MANQIEFAQFIPGGEERFADPFEIRQFDHQPAARP